MHWACAPPPHICSRASTHLCPLCHCVSPLNLMAKNPVPAIDCCNIESIRRDKCVHLSKTFLSFLLSLITFVKSQNKQKTHFKQVFDNSFVTLVWSAVCQSKYTVRVSLSSLPSHVFSDIFLFIYEGLSIIKIETTTNRNIHILLVVVRLMC